MKTKIIFLVLLFASFTGSAINKYHFLKDKENINEAFSCLTEAEQLIVNEKLDYNSFQKKYPTYAYSINDSISEDGIMDNQGAPLHIPGIFWGFFCGACGVLIVLIAMERGSERSKQISYALLGCAIWTILYLLVFNHNVQIK